MSEPSKSHRSSGMMENQKLQFVTGMVVTFAGGSLAGSAFGNVPLGMGIALVIIGFMFMAKS